ncbi:MAG: hypothetical protein J6T38_06140, partial [Bacteroidaceae bacterium]|nr:hypothetical protein [Bacteroidaceae bacterium]
ACSVSEFSVTFDKYNSIIAFCVFCVCVVAPSIKEWRLSPFTLQRYEIILNYPNNNPIIFNKKAHIF